MTVPVQHYKAYRARPLSRAQRGEVTLIFGGLTWKHERLAQGVFQSAGYRAERLPDITRRDLDAGRALVDVGACCPTLFTTGNLVNFLEARVAEGEHDVADRYAFVTFGACGPCRFGQYPESYAMALEGLGMPALRIFLITQDVKEASSPYGDGFVMDAHFQLGLFLALFCADAITDLEYLTRPYEVNPGETDRVLTEVVERLYSAFRGRPARKGALGAVALHLLSGYFTRALREVMAKWENIEVDRLRIRAKVKITGEFWVQTHEGDGNYRIKRWLEQEGAEVIPPSIAVWGDYLLQSFAREASDPTFRRSRIRRGLHGLRGRVLNAVYNRVRAALRYLPHALPDQAELRRLASPFFHPLLQGGEGHMLVGKALHAHHHNTAHMICELSPCGCIPNTMSVGAMANVVGKHPDLLYAPIEIKGDAEMHALSRCQMILSEARRRAKAEFQASLAETGLTVEAIRRYEEAHPEVRRAGYRVPHMGCAGTAANYVRHLAARIG